MADTEALRRWFTAQRTAVAGIECLEFSHVSFVSTIRITTQPSGLMTPPDDTEWLYCPMSVKPPSQNKDMSYRVEVTIQDMNQDGTSNGLTAALAERADDVQAYNDTHGVDIPVTMTLYCFIQYDDGTVSEVAEGPYELEIVECVFGETGCTFVAEPPQVNATATGRRATLGLFPMLIQWMN